MKRSDLASQFQELDRELRLKAVVELLDTVSGRTFLWWVLGVSKAVGHQPFRLDSHATAFECGQVEVGNQILAEIIEAVPSGFVGLMQEMALLAKDREDQLSQLKEDPLDD